MINVGWYKGEFIQTVNSLDEFIELVQTIDATGQYILEDGEWPDRTGDWRWVTYKPNGDGTSAIVAEKEAE